jgi:pimeloyl-ACP methyl ester carboxylesterase
MLVHGSGTLASTWAPLMPHLPNARVIAVDLPGFGLSDRYDYSGRARYGGMPSRSSGRCSTRSNCRRLVWSALLLVACGLCALRSSIPSA